MNINHAEDEVVKGDKLLAIFTRQIELMNKYHDIELKSGLMQTQQFPLNLHDKFSQARIKDFCWRIMEEVGEALDAYEQPPVNPQGEQDITHFIEELIDGLHFLTELTISLGKTQEDVWVGHTEGCFNSDFDYLEFMVDSSVSKLKRMPVNGVEMLVTNLVKNLGMMANCLKNKPWKQSQMRTDEVEFFNKLSLVWGSYIRLLSKFLTADEIVNIYLKKSQVNKFRQRSQY